MNKGLNYIKKFLKVIIWPIIFMLGQFLINYIFVAILNSKKKGMLTNTEFIDYVKSMEYKTKLNNYIDSKILIITLISAIIFIPIFYLVFKKYKKENNYNLKYTLLPIVLGITISLIYNITLFNLNNLINFTDIFEISNIPIIIEIICAGMIGPVIEELVFRGIVYNKLKEFNKPMKSIILASIIFAIFHTNAINMLYAFGVSFMFIYLYEKYKTLKAPILMHMSLNITIILMIRLIVHNYMFFNLYLLIVSIIILLIIKKVCITQK